MIPYEGRFTLIGTTDVDLDISQLNEQLEISDDEIEYLLSTINSYLHTPVSRRDIVAGLPVCGPYLMTGQARRQRQTVIII